MTSPWSQLRGALAALPPSETPPEGARLGAVLALLAETGDGDIELLLTRRREELQHHPGQVSLPGGRVEAGETVEAAALREAREECGVDPATVEVLGQLPAFYLSPSRFWLQVVVARWRAPHPLRADEGEVAEILRVRLSWLHDRQRWRVARRLQRTYSWAWQLEGGQILWGATASVVTAVLSLLDPDWHGGHHAADLPPEREVEPWVHPHSAVPRPGAPLLAGMPEVPLRQRPDTGAGQEPPAAAPAGAPAHEPPAGAPPHEPPAGAPPREPPVAAPARAGSWEPPPVAVDAGAAVKVAAAATGQLLPAGGRLLLLAGRGRTGAIGLRVAARLLERGFDVRAVLAAPEVHADGARARAALDGRARVFDGSLPRADLVLDALVGRGLDGPLRSPVRDVAVVFRGYPARVVSLDLPSGLHPARGLVGDALAADVTLTLEALPGGLLHPGLAPFVGDLYVVRARAGGGAEIVRVVPGADQPGAGAPSPPGRGAGRSLSDR